MVTNNSFVLFPQNFVTIVNFTGKGKFVSLLAKEIETTHVRIPEGITRFCICAYYTEQKFENLYLSSSFFNRLLVITRYGPEKSNIFELKDESNNIKQPRSLQELASKSICLCPELKRKITSLPRRLVAEYCSPRWYKLKLRKTVPLQPYYVKDYLEFESCCCGQNGTSV